MTDSGPALCHKQREGVGAGGRDAPSQDTAAVLGKWLDDSRAKDTSTVARFRGPRLAADALAGLKPLQGSPTPPPVTTRLAPPLFNMARPLTWVTKLSICS